MHVQELSRLCRSIGMTSADNRKLCAAVLAVQRAVENAAAAEAAAEAAAAPPGSPPRAAAAAAAVAAPAAPTDLKSVQISDWLDSVRAHGRSIRPYIGSPAAACYWRSAHLARLFMRGQAAMWAAAHGVPSNHSSSV